MKKTKKTLLTAAALAAAVNLAACTAPVGEEGSVPNSSSYDPAGEEIYDVYGPPRDESSDESSDASSENADTSSAGEDASSKNDSSKSDSSKAEASSVDETPEYDPAEDDVYEVYGPPADFEDTDISIPEYDGDDIGYETSYYAPDDYPEYDDDYGYDPEYDPDFDPEFEEIQVAYGPPPGV